MSYLADGLSQGFQSGFAAGTQRKRDKKQQEDQIKRDADMLIAQKDLMKEKDLLERVRDVARSKFSTAEADKQLKARADEIAQKNAMSASLYYDEQSRREEDAITARANKAPFEAEQLRAMKLQNDAFGQPKPLPVPMETLEYDPQMPNDPPKRRITGPVGSLGTITGAAAPAGAKPASVIDSFLTTPNAAAPSAAPKPAAAAPAARPGVFPATAINDADMQKLLRGLNGLPPQKIAEELAAAGIQISPDTFRRSPNRTY